MSEQPCPGHGGVVVTLEWPQFGPQMVEEACDACGMWHRKGEPPPNPVSDALRDAAREMPWRLEWTRGEIQGWLLDRADQIDGARPVPPEDTPHPRPQPRGRRRERVSDE